MAGEERSLGVFFDDGDLFDGFDALGHEGEGFEGAVFAGAEAGDGGFVGGVAGEVEAADAFEGEDFAVDEGAAGVRDRGGEGFGAREESFVARGRQGGPAGFHGRFLNGILAGSPCRRVGTVVVAERGCVFLREDVLFGGGGGGVGFQEVDVGAAVGAADGLGVVAAVLGVVVFGGAAGAHGEGFHGGAAAVVGGGFLDGEAGAAVCAVDEGVEVAGVLGVVEFAGAVVAGGDVGGDVDRALFALALYDLEVVEVEGGFGELFGMEGEDDGAGGGILLEGAVEGLAGGGGALGVDFDVGAFVGNGAADAVGTGEVGDEGAEADALDDAGNLGVEKRHDEKVLSWFAKMICGSRHAAFRKRDLSQSGKPLTAGWGRGRKVP